MKKVEKARAERLNDMQENIYKVANILRSHFRFDQTALLILPQIFIFRFHQLAKEEELPINYLKLKVDEMPLNSFQDLCDIMNAINRSNLTELNGFLHPFLSEYETIIGDDIIEEVFNRLSEIDYSSEYLTNREFGKYYSELLTSLFKNSHKAVDSLSTIITQNILSSIKLTPGFYRVLDPAFGVGNSIIKFFHRQRAGVSIKIFGYEKNTRTRSYAIMNLICNGIYSFDVRNSDALESDWTYKFDFITCDPPLGSREKKPFYPSVSVALIEKALHHLSNKGRALFLVSNSELHLGNFSNQRAEWVNDNLLSAVVSLQHKLGREDTSIPVSFLFFDKTNDDNTVNFIRLTDDLKLKGNNVEETSEKPIFSIKMDSEHQAISNTKEIEKNGYSLDPKLYVGSIHKKIKQLQEDNRALPLSEILIPIKANRPSKEEISQQKGKLLKIRDLKNDPFDYKIDADTISTSYSEIDKKTVSLINTDCILIANVGDSIKPTYVNADSSFLIDKGIFAFKSKEDVQIEYLIKQLHTNFVKEQINIWQTGSTIPYLSIPGFLKIILEIPKSVYESEHLEKWDISEEIKSKLLKRLRAKKIDWSDFYEAKLQATQSKDESLERFKLEKEAQEEELIDYVNHSVRNSLSVVKDSIDVLYDYMIKNEGEPIDLSAYEGQPLKGEDTSELSTINDLFTYSIDGLNRALKSLKNLEDYRVDRFNEDDLEVENIYDLLTKFRDNVSHSKSYDIIVDTKEEKSFLKSRINRDAMFNVIDNLLENAERHGFGVDHSNFTVLFNVRIDGDNVVIDYKNDGNPMLINEIEEFTSRGVSAGKNAGSGFGGFFINRTVQKLNGELILCKAEKYSRWNVYFQIKLPLEKEG